jgi:hypothetical protein
MREIAGYSQRKGEPGLKGVHTERAIGKIMGGERRTQFDSMGCIPFPAKEVVSASRILGLRTALTISTSSPSGSSPSSTSKPSYSTADMSVPEVAPGLPSRYAPVEAYRGGVDGPAAC